MSADFWVSLEPPSNGSHIVRVGGELDLAVAGQLREVLAHLDGHVRIDCKELSFVDASGIGVLVGAAARLDSLRLVNVAPQPLRVFELAGTQFLHEVPSTQEVQDAHSL
jgi:anti-sigma B factor antagonist